MRRVIAFAASVAALCWASGPLFAGIITFNEVTTLDPSSLQNGFYTHETVTGQATSISGFPSLAGVSPASITLTANEFLTGNTFDPVHLLFTASYSGPVTYFENGIPIATGTDAITVTGSVVTGIATASGFVHLTGPAGSPFFLDVLAQTGGTGELALNAPPYVVTPDANNQIHLTVSAATVTPEPSTFALLALGGGALAGWRKLKRGRTA